MKRPHSALGVEEEDDILGVHTPARLDSANTPPDDAYLLAIENEILVDSRTFHHWPELLPELQPIAIDFMDLVTRYMFSLTCTTYKDQYCDPPFTSSSRRDHFAFCSILCYKETHPRYLYLALTQCIEKRGLLPLAFLGRLAFHSRFSWLEWLLHHKSMVISRELFDAAFDGALGAYGIESYQWVIHHPLIGHYWNKTPTLTQLIATTSKGNFVLTDYLITSTPDLNTVDCRLAVLKQIWLQNRSDFFKNPPVFFKEETWQLAWTMLQSRKIPEGAEGDPRKVSEFIFSLRAQGFRFTVAVWPHLESRIQTLARSSRDFVEFVSASALIFHSIEHLDFLEKNGIPLDYLGKKYLELYKVFETLSDDNKREFFLWLWKRQCFARVYFPNDSGDDSEKLYKEIRQCMRCGHLAPDKIPFWEHMLKTYPIQGSDLMIQAAKLGAATRNLV